MPPRSAALRQQSPPDPIRAPGFDLEQLRRLTRELLSTTPGTERQEFAESFSAAAVEAYWQAAFGREMGGPPPAPGGGDLHDWALRQARRLGETLANAPRPLAAYALGTTYATLIPDEDRARNGVYYTPPPVAARLLDMLEREGTRWEQVRLLDPAAGGGAFLAPASTRIAAALCAFGAGSAEVLDHVERNVRGVELDPFAAWMGQVFSEAALWEHCRAAGRRLASIIHTGDALVLGDGFRAGFDLVVGNPPFGRLTLDPEMRKRFARSLYGHANLYGVFTDLAVRMTRRGGRIGLVTPASFLGGQYFKRLRRVLVDEAPPLALDFVSVRSGVFDQVLQETVLIVLGRGDCARPVDVCVTRPVSPAEPGRITRLGRVRLPARGETPWLLPRTRSDAELVSRASRMPHRLADHGLVVSTGPLVWNRHKDQLAAQPGEARYPLVWAEAILPGGEFSFRARRRNRQPYFALRPGQDHLLLKRAAVLVQRTTATEQARRLSAAVLPQEFIDPHGGVVVENHVNVLRPRGTANPPLRAISALLNSGVADRLFRCISGSVAVSAYELEALPLPPPAMALELERLLASGAAPHAVEDFIQAAYGLPVEALA